MKWLLSLTLRVVDLHGRRLLHVKVVVAEMGYLYCWWWLMLKFLKLPALHNFLQSQQAGPSILDNTVRHGLHRQKLMCHPCLTNELEELVR